MEQLELQLSRTPRALPRLKINPDKTDIFSFEFEDFTIEDYDPHPHIKGAVAV
jgi:thymidylate synthase